MSNTKTFGGIAGPNDSLSVGPAPYITGGASLEITDGNKPNSVLLTYEQVKILRKVLKKCMKTKGE